MLKKALVGEEVLASPSLFRDLNRGAGNSGPLKPKGNFERFPHLYECGAGQPPMNCNICGGRVPGECCERHVREPGYIALRDKYSRLFVIRAVTPTRKTPDLRRRWGMSDVARAKFMSRVMSNLGGEKDAEIKRLRKALEAVAAARMPGQARRIALEALQGDPAS